MLRVRLTPARFRVSVFDESPDPPVVAYPARGVVACWGRGLGLVEEMADGWGAPARGRGGSRLPHSRVAPEDLDAHEDELGIDLGIDAAAVRLVVEVASPGRRNQDRDRIRKRLEHARAGIPAYLLIDDYDDQGAVTLFTGPRPDKADWEDIHRVLYGTDVTIPEGPAKGFVIGEGITGPKRG